MTQLIAACAPGLVIARTGPWAQAAARGTLTSRQVGTWASQQLLWDEWYRPAVRSAAAAAPPISGGAFVQLDAVAGPGAQQWFAQQAAVHEQALSTGEIWPWFLGYGAWAQAMAGRGPAGAITLVWARETAWYGTFSVIRDAGPEMKEMMWAARQWAGPESAQAVRDLGAGVNELASAGNMPELAWIARWCWRWEALCWSALYSLADWPLQSNRAARKTPAFREPPAKFMF